MNPLPKQIALINPYLESKGWHIASHDYYIGLTGYLNQQKPDEKPTPRTEHIVSLCYFQPVSADGTVKEMMWEVKTYWQTKRALFEEFEPAWKMFLEEEKKYDPQKLVWSKLNSQEKSQ